MDKQSFNLNVSDFDRHTDVFMKTVLVIVFAYAFMLLIGLLRDRFLNKEVRSQPAQIIDLLTLLNKLFLISGFGFVVCNILQLLLSGGKSSPVNTSLINFIPNWHYLTFGVLLIFIGISFKASKKAISSE